MLLASVKACARQSSTPSLPANSARSNAGKHEPLAQDCTCAVPLAKHLIADKDYDSNVLRAWLKKRGNKPVIPPRSNRSVRLRYDKKLYRERKRIERSFG